MMIFELDECWGGIRESYELKVDFCLWVLQLDGMQVPPFNHHSGGNRVLRDAGVNAQDWSEWLRKIVLAQDGRLDWNQSLEAKQEIKRQLIQAGEAISSNINWTEALGYSEKKMLWEIEQYRLASELAYPACRFCEPSGIWTGESNVRYLLHELWQNYLSLPKKKYRNFLDANQPFFSANLWENLVKIGLRFYTAYEYYKFFFYLKSHIPHLPILNIYIIDYPVPIEYVIPPASILVSVSERIYDTGVFWQRVLKASQNLMEVIDRS
jgi:hypothetical protein